MDIVSIPRGACPWVSGTFVDEVKRLTTRIATNLTTCRSILTFFTAQSASLDHGRHRIDWARKVLDIIEEYTQLSAEHLRLGYATLEQSAKYLDVLATRWEQTLWRQEQGRAHQDMIGWLRSFEVQVLGLPPDLRRMINTATEINPSLILESNHRLQEFLALASGDKLERAEVLLPQNLDELASAITRRGDITFQPLAYRDESLIFASQRAPIDRIPGTPEFQWNVSNISELAAAFNCLDLVADIRLLKVKYFFYYEEGNQLLFAQTPPYSTLSMATLAEVIEADSFPKITTSLTERLKLAYKLAEAVFFCHTAGLLHKNITSSSVVALRRLQPPHGSCIPDIDDSYLMVSELISDVPAGTFNRFNCPRWDSEIFQHMDLLEGKRKTSYIRAYDVYSLGVVLLEVGLWQRIRHAMRDTDSTKLDLLDNVRALPSLLPKVGSRLGQGYQNAVKWCLNLTGDHIVRNDEFVREVLGPLEKMAVWV
jgi:hypothetical protein